jgi:hypothetical protein
MERLLPVALVVVLAFGVSGMGLAGPAQSCSGQLTFGGWSGQTAACTFTPAGEHLMAWAAGAGGGVAMAYMAPMPAIINVRVSIETLDGTTLLSCSQMGTAAAQCSRAAFGISDRGDILRCIVNEWSNTSHGKTAVLYGCSGL